MLIDEVKAALEGATPRPWVRDCWDILGNAKRHGGGTGHVCEVSGPNGTDDRYWKNGEADANARLISLAPDMARALIAAEAMEEACQWALAEIAGHTRYETEDQRANAMAEFSARIAAYRKAKEGKG